MKKKFTIQLSSTFFSNKNNYYFFVATITFAIVHILLFSNTAQAAGGCPGGTANSIIQSPALATCPGVPTFVVDLTGQPSGVWCGPLPSVNRNGICCAPTQSGTNCIRFVVTLDAQAEGLQFYADVSGGCSTGEFYVDCIQIIPCNTKICIGPGTHEVVFCKPGASTGDTYTITSIAAPSIAPGISVSEGCTGQLSAAGFDPTTVSWNSLDSWNSGVSENLASGSYNSYLSCQSGCLVPFVTPPIPPASHPDSILYQICGLPSGGCNVINTCMSVLVSFPPVVIPIVNPSDPTICLVGGVSVPTTLTASATGGMAPYKFTWSPGGSTNASLSVSSEGNYTVTVDDATNCPTVNSITTVRRFISNITASAGNDQIVCRNNTTVQLSGVVTGESISPSVLVGGTWSGGTGIFGSGSNSLVTTYTPSAAEIAAGSVCLTLTTSNSGSCTPASDQMCITITQFSSPISATVNDVSCFGFANGSISLVPTGGPAPFTHSWSTSPIRTTPTISGLMPGTYTDTITDGNGCDTTRTYTLTQPPAMSVDITKTNAGCVGSSDGSASVSASGGTPIYQYLWSNGATSQSVTGLQAATYNVTITDATGCNVKQPVNVTQPGVDLIAIGESSTPATCLCGSAAVSAVGGSPGYIYEWTPAGSTVVLATSPTASCLLAGDYIASVEDINGCIATSFFTITKLPDILLSISQTNISCAGAANGSATVSVSGGSPGYTYLWGNGKTTSTITGLNVGTYSIIVTDQIPCSAVATVTIAEPSPLNVSIINVGDLECSGSTGEAESNVGGGSTPYNYQWAPAVGATNVTNPSVTGITASGPLHLTVTDAGGCQSKASTVLTQPGALTLDVIQTNLSCFGLNDGAAAVSNLTGGTAPFTYKWSGNASTTTMATGLAFGTYNLSVTDANECLSVTPISITQPPLLTVTEVHSNVLCFGSLDGKATISASGGTSAYTYSWSPAPGITSGNNASGLSSQTYHATVTDALGCKATIPVVIGQPPILTANIGSLVNSPCLGVTVSAASVVSGGTPGYNYLWSPALGAGTVTASNISGINVGGTLNLLVTDINLCTANTSLTITAPTTAISGNSISTNVTCNGLSDGTATVSATGGTVPYTYKWSGSSCTTTFATGLAAGNYNVTITDFNSCTTIIPISISEPAALSATETHTNVSCNGGTTGSATVSCAGGTTPYTYTWNPIPPSVIVNVATGLSAQTYNVTVADANNCSTTIPVVITQPSLLTVTIGSIVNVQCSGTTGSASAQVSGGTSAYAYQWAPIGGPGIFTNSTLAGITSQGTAAVTVTDAKGCQAQNSAPITAPTAAISAVQTQTNVTCFGLSNGTASVTASGGTSPYTYSWSGNASLSPIATGLAAGSYTVKIVDSKLCEFNVLFAITQPVILSGSQTNTPVSCFGGSNGTANLIASGGTIPYQYTWNPIPLSGTNTIATGLSAQTYNITVSDANNCTVSISVPISQPTALTLSIGSIIEMNCAGATGSAAAVVGGGTSGYTYQWSPAIGSGNTTNQTVSGITTGGALNLTVTDANSCQQQTTVIINDPPNMSNSTAVTNVTCFGLNNGSANVTTSGGTAPYTYSWTSNSTTSSTATGFIAGTYNVTATDANGCMVASTVIITQPNALTVAESNVDVLCNGNSTGSVRLTVNGGTSAYNYSWSNAANSAESISNLTIGNYTATVTDAQGCVVSITSAITEPSPLTASASTINNIQCSGNLGTVTVATSGGASPYSFIWDNPGFAITATVTGIATGGTYNVTVTDINACKAMSSTIVTASPALSIALDPTDAACFGNSDGEVDATVSGGNGVYSYTWTSSSSTHSSISGLSAGSYSLVVRDGNGCTAILGTTVGQPSQIIIANLQIINATCGVSDGVAVFTAVGGGTPAYTYNWSSVGGASRGASNLSAGAYNITVTDALGCYQSMAVSINNQTGPTINVLSTTNLSCNGNNTGAISITAAIGSNAITGYLWAPGAATTTTITGLAAGTYIVTVTDALNCMATQSITISEPTVMNALTTQVNPLCFGGVGYASVINPSGGTGAYSYDWSAPGGNLISLSNLAAGIYNVSITDANDCELVKTITISEPSVLTSSILTSATPSCFGFADGQISGTYSGGTAPYIYVWSPGSYGTRTVSGIASGSYSLEITDANNCVASSATTILVDPPLFTAIVVSTKDVTCSGAADGEIDVTYSGGSGGNTFLWSIVGAVTPDITGLTGNTYQVTATDINGCKATTSASILTPSELIGTFNQTTILCNGGQADASIITSGGTGPGTYNFIWSNASTNSIITGLSAGTYQVTITDANACTFKNTLTISEPASLSATLLSSSDVSCFGSSDGQIATSTSGGTPFSGGTYSYSWNSTIGSAPTISGIPIGTYNVTVTDANGCKDFITTIGISQPQPFVAQVISVSNVLCNGQSTGAINMSVSGGNTSNPYTFAWTPNVSITEDAIALPQGTYQLTATDIKGCKAYADTVITQPQPLVGTPSITSALCSGQTSTASVFVSGGNSSYSYSWSPLPATGSNAFASSLTVGTYTVVVTDANNCTITNSFNITAPTPILFGFDTTPTPVSCFGFDNGAIATSITGGTPFPGPTYAYRWTSTAGPVTGNGSSILNLKPGSYNVTVTDANGCEATLVNTIITEPAPIMADVINVTNIQCFGLNNGAIDMSVYGGNTPYTFVWSPNVSLVEDANNLPQGNYQVTATDIRGCVVTANAVVRQPLQLAGNPNTVPALCSNLFGSASVSVTGGTGSYTYRWDPAPAAGVIVSSAANLTAGTYNVTVTDANNCTITESFNITIPSLLSVGLAALPSDVTCFGMNNGSITTSATGGTPFNAPSTPYTYRWSNTANAPDLLNLIAGNYNLTITDANGCQATLGSTNVSEPAAFLATVITINDVSCNGLSDGSILMSYSGGSGVNTYSWTNGAGTNQDASALSANTYDVVATDSRNCVTSARATVNQPNPLVLSTSQTDALCDGLFGSASVSPSGGTINYSFLWDAAAGSAITSTANSLAAGSYNVTVTDNNFCKAQTNITITQPALLVGELVSTSNTSCNGVCDGKLVLSASGGTSSYSYDWIPNVSTGPTASGLCSQTYTVSITDVNGCNALFTQNITEPAPLLAFISKTDVLCNVGNTGTATGSGSGGTIPYTYNWLAPLNVISQTVSGLSDGTYPMLIRDNNGCEATETVTILRPPLLEANAFALKNTICSLPIGIAGNQVNGGTPGYSYLWNDPLSQSTPTATGLLAPANYNVTVTDANGCTDTATINLTDEPTGTPVIQSSSNIACFGGNDGAITLTMIGGKAQFFYKWDPSISISNSASNLSANTQYCATITDDNGCQASICHTLSQPAAALEAAVTSTNILCNGEINGTASILMNGGTPPYTQLWFTSPNQITATASGLPVGIYSVQGKDSKNCLVTVNNIQISEPNPLTATAVETIPVACNGQFTGVATAFPQDGTPPYSYSWATPTPQTGQQATGLPAGSYGVIVTDFNGCTASAAVTITENGPITTIGNEPQPVCVGQVVQLFASAIGGGPLASNTYAWNQDNPVAPSAIMTGNTFTYTALQDTLISVTVLSQGCWGSSIQIPIKLTSFIASDLLISPAVTICRKDTADIETSIGPNAVGANDYLYTWTPNTFLSPTATASDISVSPPVTTTYEVTVVSGCGVTQVKSVDVNIKAIPIIKFTTDQLVECQNDCVEFTNKSTATGSTIVKWEWDFGDGGTSSEENPTHCYNTAGVFNVKLKETTSLGCSDTSRNANTLGAKPMTINPIPTASFSFSPESTTIFDAYISFTDNSTNAIKWYWFFGDETGPDTTVYSSIEQSPVHNYLEAGLYSPKLVVEDINSCKDTLAKWLSLEILNGYAFYIPNAFTPEKNDTINATFTGKGISILDFQMDIFDRWGILLFHSDDVNNGWDGTVKSGKIAPEDVYIYRITVRDIWRKLHYYDGTVTLIR